MVHIYVTYGEAICQLSVLKSQKIRAVRNNFFRETGVKEDGDLYYHGEKLLGYQIVADIGIQEDSILEFLVVHVYPRVIAISVFTIRAKGRETLQVEVPSESMTIGLFKTVIVRDYLPFECPSPSQLLLTYNNTELFDHQTIHSLEIPQNTEIRAKIIPNVENPNLSYDIIATTINGQSLSIIEAFPTKDLVINFTIADDTPKIAQNQVLLTIYSQDEAREAHKQIEITRIDSMTEHKQFTISYTTHEELLPDTVYWMRLQSFYDRYIQDEEHSVVTISFRTAMSTTLQEILRFSWPRQNATWSVPLLTKLQGLGDLFRLVREYLHISEPHLVDAFNTTVTGFLITRQDEVLTGGRLLRIPLKWDDQVRAVLPVYDIIVLCEADTDSEPSSSAAATTAAAAAAAEEVDFDTLQTLLNIETASQEFHQERVTQQQLASQKESTQRVVGEQQQLFSELYNDSPRITDKSIVDSVTSSDTVSPVVEEQQEAADAIEEKPVKQADDNEEESVLVGDIEALALQTMVDELYPITPTATAELDAIQEEEEEEDDDEVDCPPALPTEIRKLLEEALRAEKEAVANNSQELNNVHHGCWELYCLEHGISLHGDLLSDSQAMIDAETADQTVVDTEEVEEEVGAVEVQSEPAAEAASEVNDNDEEEIPDFLDDDGEFVFVNVPPSDLQSILLTDDAAHADFAD